MKKMNDARMEQLAASGLITCSSLRDDLVVAVFSFNYTAAVQAIGLSLFLNCPLAV